FFQAEDGIRDDLVTGVQTCALPICGIGVMSRLPIRAQQLIPREQDDGWFPALRLILDSPLGPVQALVVHLRPPVSDGGSFVSGHFTAPAIHEKEITRFCQALDRNLPTMVVGDFN